MFGKISVLSNRRGTLAALAMAATATLVAPATSALASSPASAGGGCKPLVTYNFGSVNACISASGTTVKGDFYLHLNAGYHVTTFALVKDSSTGAWHPVYGQYGPSAGYTGYQHITLPAFTGTKGHYYFTQLSFQEIKPGTSPGWVDTSYTLVL